MIIGGLYKSSLIDYPGHLSCIIFLSGCNFRCPYCYNPQLAQGCPAGVCFIRERHVFDFLEKRKGFLDGVVISGGEPTLQKGLISFCEKIKGLGYQIKLDTNGSRPEVLTELIEKHFVDYVAMDIKTPVSGYDTLFKMQDTTCVFDISDSISAIMNSGIDYEFRTTCVKPYITIDNVSQIGAMISGAKLYALQELVNTNVLYPNHFKGKKNICTKNELVMFKDIASQYVKECIIR